MLLQTGDVVLGMFAQQTHETIAEACLLKDRPECNVQDLPRVELLEQGRRLRIAYSVGHTVRLRRDVVASPVLLVASAGEIVDLTEQVGVARNRWKFSQKRCQTRLWSVSTGASSTVGTPSSSIRTPWL